MLHAKDDVVIGVAGDTKPSTRIDESRVPALHNVVGIRKPSSKSRKSVSYKFKQTSH